MFIVDLALSYFVSFIHDYCNASLVCFFNVDVCVLFNSINAWSLRDKLHFGFVISISARCDLTSSR